jgi:hypothetical protein
MRAADDKQYTPLRKLRNRGWWRWLQMQWLMSKKTSRWVFVWVVCTALVLGGCLVYGIVKVVSFGPAMYPVRERYEYAESVSDMWPSVRQLEQVRRNVSVDELLVGQIERAHHERDVVGVADYQRVFGKLYENVKRLRSWLRQTTGEQRASYLAVLECVLAYETTFVRLGELLYPWMRGGEVREVLGSPLGDLVGQKVSGAFVNQLERWAGEGVGIVQCVGNHYAKYTFFFVRHLRALNCTLDVELFFAGESDLSPHNQELLRSLPGVTLRDLTAEFDQRHVRLAAWALKPFSILASRFRHVILVDSDVVFFQPPEIMLEDPVYVEYGTLFFKDRSIMGNDPSLKQWLVSILRSPSPYLMSTRMWHLRTLHEMESGVVVFDKHRNLLPLLSVAKLNSGILRDAVIYERLYGDKDTFWLGFELVRQPYGFSLYPTGVLAAANRTNATDACSTKILHSNEYGLLWFNGGVMRNKKFDDSAVPLAYYKNEIEWDPERPFQINGLWKYDGPLLDEFCLQVNQALPIPPHDLRTIALIHNVWNASTSEFELSSL